MNTAAIKALNDLHIINTYGERRLALVRGEGVWLWDADGGKYLDLLAGIAVTALGHCHPAVTKAISEQAATLVHVSNLYYIEPQVKLAALLCEHSFADRWFFANCGATANEAAIKLARRYWAQKGTPKPVVLSARQSFHGRTLATVTATGQPKYHEGFEPLMAGVQAAFDYNDIASIEEALTLDTGAILLEPLQGEGGVRVPSDSYLGEVRALCDARGILLILDEVQTGVGRTGAFFAHQHTGVTPDIVTTAKALGNGVPIGAMGCTEEVASGFSVGSHATTFGGNPLCAAAALATVTEVVRPGFLEHVTEVGGHFMAGLRAIAGHRPAVAEVRGKGLLIGVACDRPVKPAVDHLLDHGVIAGVAGPNVLRFAPPLILQKETADQALEAVDAALGVL
jgi:acetylornithine/N-succinyldiaminopimelate aminotransferase